VRASRGARRACLGRIAPTAVAMEGPEMKNAACRATLALAGIALLGAVASASDYVVMKNDVRHSGKVIRDDAKGVTLKLKPGGQAVFDRSKVKEVLYDEGERPMEYRIGVESFKKGRYEAALESLTAAMEAKHHPLLEQYILYYIGLSSKELGRPAKAVAAFEKLEKQGTKTRFLNEAIKELVGLEIESGNPKKAEARLKKARALIGRVQYGYNMARIAERQGRHAEAERLYKQAAASGDPVVAEQAVLGVARCLVARKRPEDAVRRLRGFIKRERSPTISAQAYVLLGDALKAQAKTPDDWEQAMLAYMRVPCLYEGDEATEAKALYEASRCFRAMNAEKSAKRAARLVSELKRRYPNSTWAAKVR